jgi:hypothetical protein
MNINLQESIKIVENAIGCLVETIFDNGQGSLNEMHVGNLVDANYSDKLNEAALRGDLLASNIDENECEPSAAFYDANMLNDDAITPS